MCADVDYCLVLLLVGVQDSPEREAVYLVSGNYIFFLRTDCLRRGGGWRPGFFMSREKQRKCWYRKSAVRFLV